MQIYNSLTRKKELFVPLEKNKVKLYVCGITAYDYCHIGHARSALVFDVLVRYLRYCGLDVTFVRNFTDVDDKIINRANKENIPSEIIAKTYIKAFHEDMDNLDVLRADFEPLATEHIANMIIFIKDLIAKGFAYQTLTGDVYYRVRTFSTYGKLSGRNIEDLQSGARIMPGEEKNDPLDFALWKSAKPNEPFWDSPWGKGRPGWHIECSAMAKDILGKTIDIHGGGQDLEFPHHDNEIAQSEAANDAPFAKYWVHNGFVQINSEKMSKSLNNFVTIRDILQNYLPEVLRFFLLTKHYRSPIDYTDENIVEAEKSLKRIYATKAQITLLMNKNIWQDSQFPTEYFEQLNTYSKSWDLAMQDDLNSAAALGHIFSMVRLANKIIDTKNIATSKQAQQFYQGILDKLDICGKVLGLFKHEAIIFLEDMKNIQMKRYQIDKTQIDVLLEKYTQAKINKNFTTSDQLRTQLTEIGIMIKDTPNGIIWDIVK